MKELENALTELKCSGSTPRYNQQVQQIFPVLRQPFLPWWTLVHRVGNLRRLLAVPSTKQWEWSHGRRNWPSLHEAESAARLQPRPFWRRHCQRSQLQQSLCYTKDQQRGSQGPFASSTKEDKTGHWILRQSMGCMEDKQECTWICSAVTAGHGASNTGMLAHKVRSINEEDRRSTKHCASYCMRGNAPSEMYKTWHRLFQGCRVLVLSL